MAQDESRLRLNIDGRWSAAEMSACFSAVSDLYALRHALEVLREDASETDSLLERFYFGRVPQRSANAFRRLQGLAALSTTPLVLQSADDLVSILQPAERLQVRAVHYGSEGFKDLSGIGTAIGHLKDLILKLIDLGTGRKRRKLEEESLEIDNEGKRLKNAREYLGLIKDLGYSEGEVRKMVTWSDKRQLVLVGLVQDQKLIGVDKPSSKDRGADVL